MTFLKSALRFILNLDTLFGTLFIFFFIAVIGLLPIDKIKTIDPISEALKDFETTDMVFKFFNDDTTGIEDDIVIVNIGELPRAGIAKQLEIINKYEPAVVGIDVRFIKEKSPDQDFPLMMAFAKIKNLVLVNRLDSTIDGVSNFRFMETSNPMFSQYGYTGFANLHAAANEESEQSFRTSRVFVPFLNYRDTVVNSFSAEIVKLYNPEKFEILKSRRNFEEIINWKGNYLAHDFMNSKYQVLDVVDVLNENFDPAMIKNKIVLFGFMGRNLQDEFLIDDKFYTPLNDHLAGRAYPDMYGVVIHANIISMILNETYIDTSAIWFTALISFLVVFLNVGLFIYIAEKSKIYYDLITKVWQLLLSIIILYLVVIFMAKFSYKFEATFLIIALLLSGDLTELYAGSIRLIGLKVLHKFGLIDKEVSTEDES